MKRGFRISVLIGFIGLGFIFACSKKTGQPPAPVNVNQPAAPRKVDQPTSTLTARDILQAHNALQRTKALSTYFAKSVKLTSVSNKPGDEMPSSLEQSIEVSVNRNMFKRYREFPQGVRKEYHTFDGRTGYSLVIEKDKPEEGVGQMRDSELASVKFGVRSFGLLPFLNELANPEAGLVYLGRVSHGEDKLKVTTSTTSFIVYVDPRHVIRRVEVGTKTIEFWDYEFVSQVLLPFDQRVYVNNQLSYELIFKKILLDPPFPDGYFTREAIYENIAF